MTRRCQLDHKGRHADAEFVLTYRGTRARWYICARHAQEYQGPEWVVVRLAEPVG